MQRASIFDNPTCFQYVVVHRCDIIMTYRSLTNRFHICHDIYVHHQLSDRVHAWLIVNHQSCSDIILLSVRRLFSRLQLGSSSAAAFMLASTCSSRVAACQQSRSIVRCLTLAVNMIMSCELAEHSTTRFFENGNVQKPRRWYTLNHYP